MALDNTTVKAVQDAFDVAAKELVQAATATASAETAATAAHQAAAAAKKELGEVSSAMAALRKAVSTLTAVEPPSPPPTGDAVPKDRFLAAYYDGVNFDTFVAKRLEDAIALNLTEGQTVLPGLVAQTFSARWVGDFTFDDGTYRFTVKTGDGVRLYIDNALVLDKWFDQGPTAYTVEKPLKAGVHRIKVEYYQNGGLAALDLKWAKASVPPQPTPTPTPGGWTLDWEDHFEGTSVDTTKWHICDRDQYSPANVSVANSVLTLAVKNISGVFKGGSIQTGTPSSLSYRVSTSGWRKQLKIPYRVEAAIKWSDLGSGVVVAAGSYTDWTPISSGSTSNSTVEIEFLEHRGSQPDEGQYSFHRWLWANNFTGAKSRETRATIQHDLLGYGANWHIYAVEVDRTETRFYLDGVQKFKVDHSYTNIYDFLSKPAALVLDLCTMASGYGAENGRDTSKIPAYMHVDWVKVYKKS